MLFDVTGCLAFMQTDPCLNLFLYLSRQANPTSRYLTLIVQAEKIERFVTSQRGSTTSGVISTMLCKIAMAEGPLEFEVSSWPFRSCSAVQ